jgi:hypothetical protein
MHRFQLGVLVIAFCFTLPNSLSAAEPDARTSQVISIPQAIGILSPISLTCNM